jgi:ribulose-5-phosphate 4-epimerase/fuculose-1-phosphate aldolase
LNHTEERQSIIELSELLVRRGALSLSLHGNISLRLADGERVLVTGSSLAGLQADTLAVVDLDGQVLEGHVSPAEAEILPMHLEPYRIRDDLRCLVHTHSPAATTFAVASTPLPIVAESLARWDVLSPIPVAAWAPRGSAASVAGIVAHLAADRTLTAVLLENHGILVGGTSTMQVARRVMAIEENAQLALAARSLGGAKELDLSQAGDAAARRQRFEAAGGVGAAPPA